MSSQLVFLNLVARNVERRKKRNKQLYQVLIKKKVWDSIMLFSKMAQTKPQSVYSFLRTLEEEGCICMQQTYSEGQRVMIVLQPSIYRYRKIWRQYKNLNGLFKTDIKRLLSRYTTSFVALILGYSGNANIRNNSLRETLTKLGWWKEFKEEGII